MLGYHRHLPPHTTASDPTLTPFCYRALGRRALQAGVMKAFNSWLEHGDDVRKMKKFAGRLLNRKVAKAWGTWEGVCASGQKLQKFAARCVPATRPSSFGASLPHTSYLTAP